MFLHLWMLFSIDFVELLDMHFNFYDFIDTFLVHKCLAFKKQELCKVGNQKQISLSPQSFDKSFFVQLFVQNIDDWIERQIPIFWAFRKYLYDALSLLLYFSYLFSSSSNSAKPISSLAKFWYKEYSSSSFSSLLSLVLMSYSSLNSFISLNKAMFTTNRGRCSSLIHCLFSPSAFVSCHNLEGPLQTQFLLSRNQPTTLNLNLLALAYRQSHVFLLVCNSRPFDSTRNLVWSFQLSFSWLFHTIRKTLSLCIAAKI